MSVPAEERRASGRVLCYSNGYLPQRQIVVIPEERWRHEPLWKLVDRGGLFGNQVYLAGGPYAADHPTREWLEEPARYGYRVSRIRSDPAGCRLTDAYGRHCDITMTSAWFGSDPAARDADISFLALYRLSGLLRGAFGDRAHLYATPTRTGLGLLQRSLPHDENTDLPSAYYEPVPDHIAELIRTHIGQGRREYVASPWIVYQPLFERLYCYDARWMYASCLRMLPAGPVQHDFDVPDLDPDATGFYRVTFRVPADWHEQYGIGLLPVYDQARERAFWPTSGEWGEYEAWCGHAELALAKAYGWDYRILERILWHPQQHGADPLRTWRDRLVRTRDRVQEREGHRFRGDTNAECDHLVSGALRSILVGSIGGFARTDGWDDCVVPEADAWRIPRDCADLRAHSSEISYRVRAPLTPDLVPFQHPEWNATVWSRARAKTNHMALRYLDACRHLGMDGWLVALRSDAIVVSQPLPVGADPMLWPGDTGKPGAFRLKPMDGIGWPSGEKIWLPGKDSEFEAMWRALLAANRQEFN